MLLFVYVRWVYTDRSTTAGIMYKIGLVRSKPAAWTGAVAAGVALLLELWLAIEAGSELPWLRMTVTLVAGVALLFGVAAVGVVGGAILFFLIGYYTLGGENVFVMIGVMHLLIFAASCWQIVAQWERTAQPTRR